MEALKKFLLIQSMLMIFLFRRSEKSKINQIGRVVPEMLQEAGLYKNLNKITHYYVSKEGDTS